MFSAPQILFLAIFQNLSGGHHSEAEIKSANWSLRRRDTRLDLGLPTLQGYRSPAFLLIECRRQHQPHAPASVLVHSPFIRFLIITNEPSSIPGASDRALNADSWQGDSKRPCDAEQRDLSTGRRGAVALDGDWRLGPRVRVEAVSGDPGSARACEALARDLEWGEGQGGHGGSPRGGLSGDGNPGVCVDTPAARLLGPRGDGRPDRESGAPALRGHPGSGVGLGR